MLFRVVGMLTICALLASFAQQAPVTSVNAFIWREDGPVLNRPVQNGEPFTVAGQRGVIVGQQSGTFEAWTLPIKLLSHMTIEANVEGYPVPIDLNEVAREIEVRPDRTTITYSHIALTLRQTMFSPDEMPDGTGPIVIYQVDSLRPVDLVFRFTAEMRKMWPALSSGTPSPEWVSQGASGFYVLHSDFPDFAGAVALPQATSGVMAPYQERPQVHPLEFHLRIDPKTDRGRAHPLLMAVGTSSSTATTAALAATLEDLDRRLASIYAAHADRYRNQEKTLTQISTPDAKLDHDFLWAETAIGQLQARTPQGESGLVAGYYASGDSARPGFGWFFGRDSLYTIFAIDSYGDFALARKELEFLMRRQRQDGKMMHEYSQTAAEVDWKTLPYQFAAADATPLFLMAMLDYVRASGDLPFLNRYRDNVVRAWNFETKSDTDGDGIYDNAQGTGWVESWPSGMPKQEIYLALLDEQASFAVGELSRLLGDEDEAKKAMRRAVQIQATIQREYYLPESDRYAFSWNTGTADRTATIFPAIAWWSGGQGLDHAQASLQSWASHHFATDWGLRDVADNDASYDSMSYHQGSVWPLFTGWAALAQYRAGRSLAGYQALMQNADLTTAQDLGAVTELLSGDFFEPFGRSTSHQLWSSAMVITPLLRGLFGIEVNGLKHELTITPRIPAAWDNARVDRLRVGDSMVDVSFRREEMTMVVALATKVGSAVHFASGGTTERLLLPVVEVGLQHQLPLRGARTTQMKVLNEEHSGRSLHLELEAAAGQRAILEVRRNDRTSKIVADGGDLRGDKLYVQFPSGTGYIAKRVTLRW